MSEEVRKEVFYQTIVTQWWRGSAVSPVSGQEIIAYGETVEDARRQVDLQIVKEAHAAGLSVERLMEPKATVLP